MKHIWTEKLGALAFLAGCALHPVLPRRYFAETVSGRTQRLVARLGRFGIPHPAVETVIVRLAAKDQNGVNIRARMEDLKAAIARDIVGDDADRLKLPRDVQPFAAEWLRILTLIASERNATLVNHLATLENAYATGSVSAENVREIRFTYSCRTALKACEQACAKRVQLPVKASFRFHRTLADWRKILSAMAWVAGAGALKAVTALRQGKSKTEPFVTDVPAEGKLGGTVLVQFEKYLIQRLPFSATFDWFPGSGVAPEKVVLYCNRQEMPFDAQALEDIAAQGLSRLDLLNSPATRFTAGMDVRDCWAVVKCLPGQPFWEWLVLARHYHLILRYRTMLRRVGAVALYQHEEFTSSQLFLNLACRMEDVLFIWGYWSFLGLFASWYNGAFADLFLAWGDYDLGHNLAQDFDFTYAAKVGVIGYDGLDDHVERDAAAARAQLNESVSFVVSLLDSSHDPDGRNVHHETANVLLFYNTVFDLMDRHAHWGCVIKSKWDAFELLLADQAFSERIRTFQEEGRCVILDSQARPVFAALAGDVTACFSVNSAGITSALHSGKPTVHFDPQGMRMFPLYDLGAEGRIIFTDAAAFSEALDGLGNGGEAGIGDIGPWRHLVDPFADGRGRERVGEIIAAYLRHRDGGQDMLPAVRAALQEYGQAHGQDRVVVRGEASAKACPGGGPWVHVREQFYEHWPQPLPATGNAQWSQQNGTL